MSVFQAAYDRSVKTTYYYTSTSYYDNGGGETYGPFDRTGYVGRMNLNTGTYLRGHEVFIRNGISATTDRTKCTFRFPGLYQAILASYDFDVNRSGIVSCFGNLYEPVFPFLIEDYTNVPSLRDTSLPGLTLRKFLKNITDKQREFQSGPFVGQLTKTLHEVARPAKALREGLGGYIDEALENARRLGKLKVSRRRKFSLWANVVSGLWLEWSFGWKPLMMDLDGASKALNDFYVSGFDSIRSAGILKSHIVDEVPYPSVSLDYPYGVLVYDRYVTTTVDESYRTVGGIKVTSGSDGHRALSERLGLTMSEFLPTVWELLPWSFLIDYFSDIGGTLDALAALDSDWIFCAGTLRQDLVTQCRLVFNLGATIANGSGSSRRNFGGTTSLTPWKASVKLVKRVGVSPSLGSFPLIDLQLPSSASRWASMDALLTQNVLIRGYLNRF